MYRSTHWQLIKLLLFGVFVLVGCEQQSQLIEQRILQFGTIIDISLIHKDPVKSERALIEIEQQLSAYRQSWHAWEDSELTRFNQALNATRPVEVPGSLVELINMSQAYFLKSNRLFNPALGKLIAAYGFHGQLDPDEQTISIIQQDPPSMLDLKVKNGFATSNNKHMKLDFGGIAKGYAVALVADYLQQQGFENYLINAGGDLVSSGNKFGTAWKIGLQNPFKPGVIASISLLGKQSVFTSGNYQRFYRKDNKLVHHIIDPRSGEPSEQISSATVMSSDPVLADVAATTLMIDGLNNHRSLAGSLGISDYMIIDEDQKVIISATLANKIEMEPGLAVKIIE